jgi:hypothetical protein
VHFRSHILFALGVLFPLCPSPSCENYKTPSFFTKNTLLTVVISCKHFQDYSPKAVNEFLEFVAYFFWSFVSKNRNVHAGASELLSQGGYFSEVCSAQIFSIAWC